MPPQHPAFAVDASHPYSLVFDANHLAGRTFLLGNGGGFTLYLPAWRNTHDKTLHPGKWFGANGFGRAFMKAIVVAADVDGTLVELNRSNQVAFVMDLDSATRVYRIAGKEIRETLFVPDGMQAFVWSLLGDLPFLLRPEFDMRYYQEFNTDFSRYRAETLPQGLLVSNCVEDVGVKHTALNFFASFGALSGEVDVSMIPEDQRLLPKTYLKDEAREKLVNAVFAQTQVKGPDEAPIWDKYSSYVYSPARFHTHGAVTFVGAFGDSRDEVMQALSQVSDHLPTLRTRKKSEVNRRLADGLFQTGNRNVDLAYSHVFTRFNDALVARDATLHVEPHHREHYYAIFAGDKYFMDAWKRDENISLVALLVTNDYETVRQILDDTWQFQDERTGRLPHIIRAGEPLVYYSSDGTLWALHRLYQYTRQSGDASLLDDKLPMVERFFEASMTFVQRGFIASGGIIEKDYLWETWEDTPYTPRAGYPVEIELLWLTVLTELLPFIAQRNQKLADVMAACLATGRENFPMFEGDGYLVDSLSYDWKQDSILTPNGFVSFALRYPLSPQLGASMVRLARQQLAGQRGIRSLAPRDWPSVLPAAFLEDPAYVSGNQMASVGIYNYHRGIEWEWLNPFFVEGELQYGSTQNAYRLYVHGQVEETLYEAGIGGLSELHDLRGQVGADFQAWSMAGFLHSLHLFAGIDVDAIAKTVNVQPSLPAEWPFLRCRRRAGDTRFDLHYEESPTARKVKITLLDSLPDGYTLNVGMRVHPGSMILSATWNGESIPTAVWREDSTDTDEKVVWLTRPWTGDFEVEMMLGHGDAHPVIST